MKFKELKTKPEAEIRQLLEDLKSQAHELAVKVRLDQAKNTAQVKALKRDIARVLTFIKQNAK